MGLCASKTALDWMDAVDLRHDQIAEVYTGYVRNELEKRGVLGEGFTIHASSRSNLVARSAREALRHAKGPCLENFLQGLDEENDGLWRNFYRHVPARERPQNWEDLGYLFYIFEVVRSALVTQPMPETRGNSGNSESKSLFADRIKTKPRRLIVSIDDAAERRIYSKAQEILKKLRSSAWGMTVPTLLEVYLCRKLFVNGNKHRARLFHHDPMPRTALLCQSSEQDSEEKCSMKPLDVVRRIHGANCAHCLQALFAKAGL
ncbi:MAG: hypothetical protein LQ338_000850 [Usnochroma carphineum]|nr:MAG: hypothetical protein LQ338_000850 [Usnochroma carphineum]